MSDWKPKKFWKNAEVQETEGRFGVALDGRTVRTPAKAVLEVPTRAMAEEIAAEWNAQVEILDPLAMPFTRSANAALDKVRHQHAEVADMLAEYGDSDLVCYRAEHPKSLVARQSEHWDPALDWLEQNFGVRLVPVSGVIHSAQSRHALTELARHVHALNPFQLAAFHDLVSLSGSLVLGLAAARDWQSPDAIWNLSRLDETWQEQQWGEDEVARQNAELKRVDFLHAKRFYDLST